VNNPQFKVFGQERRALKKVLSEKESLQKNFWRFHQIDKDLVGIFGGGCLMSDQRAKELFEKREKEIEELKKILSEPHV
jgi:hypothetical protein